MTLADVKEGETVRVIQVGGSGLLRRRLLEMGLVRGSEVQVERFAPLRDPIQIRVKGSSLALRIAEGSQISVEPLSEVTR